MREPCWKHAARRAGWRGHGHALLFAACLLLGLARGQAAVGNDAQLVSVSIQPGTEVAARTTFVQTWTFLNTGTNTWTPGRDGYTLNLLGMDGLGAVPLLTNSDSSLYQLAAVLNSGKSVAPGAQGSYRMSFIAPEISGSVTDRFQLNSASSVYYGPTVTVQVAVTQLRSTNQYDRARAVAYANTYGGKVCSDGYFWTNGSTYVYYGAQAAVPSKFLGDDCAHFVSSCIGSQAGTNRGGGLLIPSRVTPPYGEPGAGRLINTCLIGSGAAVEVFSLTNLAPGDVIGWNWEGDTNIANIDHVTLYLGNSLLASHSASALDVAPAFFGTGWAWHLIHILDAPTLASAVADNRMILSWGTNWTGYALYTAPSLSSNTSWVKVAATPGVAGNQNVLTNALSPGTGFYRLLMP
jgi:hypothetical protein